MSNCDNMCEICELKKNCLEANAGMMYQAKEIDRLKKELERYKTAEKEGKLVILPVKVHDIIYHIEGCKILAKQVYVIECQACNGQDVLVLGSSIGGRECFYARADQLGEKWFLSKEAAELYMNGGAK